MAILEHKSVDKVAECTSLSRRRRLNSRHLICPQSRMELALQRPNSRLFSLGSPPAFDSSILKQ
ncbi:hypothetical protein LINPERHAP1_LOCUS15961 [Linum perenne]